MRSRIPRRDWSEFPQLCLVSSHTSQPHYPSLLLPSPPIHAGTASRFSARRSRAPLVPVLFMFCFDRAICAQGKQPLRLRVTFPLIGLPSNTPLPTRKAHGFPIPLPRLSTNARRFSIYYSLSLTLVSPPPFSLFRHLSPSPLGSSQSLAHYATLRRRAFDWSTDAHPLPTHQSRFPLSEMSLPPHSFIQLSPSALGKSHSVAYCVAQDATLLIGRRRAPNRCLSPFPSLLSRQSSSSFICPPSR